MYTSMAQAGTEPSAFAYAQSIISTTLEWLDYPLPSLVIGTNHARAIYDFSVWK